MKITRRQFIKGAAATGIGLALPLKFGIREARAFYQSSQIPLWNTAFRNAGAIPVALPDPTPAPTTGVKHYTINIRQFQDQLLPGTGTPTTLWGFEPANALAPPPGTNPAHLGGIILAKKGEPIQITFRNRLTSDGTPTGTPLSHIIPVDTSIPGPNQQQNRTAVHVHGGFVPWISDGGPFDWWMNDGTHGASFLNNEVLRGRINNSPQWNPDEAEYYYPNDQSARLVWYHDHAWGITRINAYAGIASAYIIRDDYEANLVVTAGLPPYVETSVLGGAVVQELPIVVQDKIFVDAATIANDTRWTGPTTTGSLWYAHYYDPLRWTLQKGFPIPNDPSVIAEFFGDTMLCNGTAYPEVGVEPRRYRLRILNACNARFLNLQLYVDDGTANGITLNAKTGNPLNAPFRNAAAPNPVGKPTPSFLVIGSEGGFLPSAIYVPSNMPMNAAALTGSLILGPAERSDVIVDFKNHAGQNLILYTDAPAPFPVGDPRNDYFPGWNVKANLVNAATKAGFGPNSRVIMRFRVGPAPTSTDATLTITKGFSFVPGIDPLLVNPATANVQPDPAIPGNVLVTLANGSRPSVFLRSLTLNETFDGFGRLIQYEGTNVPLVNAKTGFGRAYLDPATEIINKDNVEVWQIANLTGDTHPIHFHLVNVQIISRQAFSVNSYNGVPNVTGALLPPDPSEMGWKETVRMNPGEVTTVIMQFKFPTVPFNVPFSTRPMGGTVTAPAVIPNANEYVWHCHILEHEEHDMMRPLVVLGQTPQGVIVWPNPQTVKTSGGTAVFNITGQKTYSVSATEPSGVSSVLATDATTNKATLTVTVAQGTAAGTVTYTITDSIGKTATATLNIVV